MHTSFTDSTKLETFIHKTWSSNSNYKTWSGFDLTLINRLLLSKMLCRKIHVSFCHRKGDRKKFGTHEKIEGWLGKISTSREGVLFGFLITGPPLRLNTFRLLSKWRHFFQIYTMEIESPESFLEEFFLVDSFSR